MIMNQASPVHVGPWHGLSTCKLCLDRLGPWRGIDPLKPSGHWRGINPRKPWPGSLQSYQYYNANKYRFCTDPRLNYMYCFLLPQLSPA